MSNTLAKLKVVVYYIHMVDGLLDQIRNAEQKAAQTIMSAEQEANKIKDDAEIESTKIKLETEKKVMRELRQIPSVHKDTQDTNVEKINVPKAKFDKAVELVKSEFKKRYGE